MFYKKTLSIAKEFILDIIFPKYCINCGKEGGYLCPDCFSLIDIFEQQYCPFCFPPKIVFEGKTCISCKKFKKLNGLYCAASYDSFIVKKLINQFKYGPHIKELSKPLASLIINHLMNLNKLSTFNNFSLIPVPLHKKKLRQRGFNQAQELAKELSETLKIPIINNVLIKIKQTPAQMELKKEEREKNIRGVFSCQKPDLIRDKKILLVDDVLTTGSTMEECTRALKGAGAKEVWGIVAARG